MKKIVAGLLLLGSLGVQAQKKEIQYLSGTASDHTVAWDFFCTSGRNSGKWTTIQVPFNWEQQGFGAYNYGRDYKTYGKNFRFADEKGLYKYNFNVPASWKGKRVFIVFEGSMTDTEVKINGKPAGDIHQGSFYRFKYDITDKLQYGKSNLLEAAVSKMSADASVNNAERLADYWVFGGIFRPVYLEATPASYIDYAAIDAKADGSFKMNVFLKNIIQAAQVTATITDLKGKQIATTQTNVAAKDSFVTINTVAKNILTWNAETPNLYKVNIALKAGGKLLYEINEKFGFRTIEIRKEDGIYLNGVKIKMRGANRHCIWPETGRTLTDKQQLDDALLLKEMNMNAVRCSHYPPDKRFLEICDSLGLYVLDELAGWQKAYGTPVGEKLVKEMVLRDLNHPSVIFWSNGNEGGHNKSLDDDYGKYDLSNRPVIHAHHRPGNAFNGIDCNHYEDYYSTQKILADTNIYMVTEFLHSQDDGGGGAALSDFWDLHWNSKKGAGGFLWAFVDEGIVRTDLNNIIDVNGLNAPDGVLGPHREKEGSYYAIRQIFSPVKIDMKELPADFNGNIAVENRYHFTNINQCSFQWGLVNYRKPGEQFTGYSLMKKGTATAPSIAPVQIGNLQLNLPADWKNYDALVLAAYDPFKKEVYRWTWKVKSNEQLLQGILVANNEQAKVVETDSTFSLTGGEVTIVLNKKTGMLAGVRNNASDPMSFANGPVLVSGNAAITGVKQYAENNEQVVEFSYSGNMKYVKWKMNGSGWVSLDYEYNLDGDYSFAGVSFSYPENFVLGARWLGKGPVRVWKNRLQGVTTNVWENMYNNTQTGSAPWIFPEFKGYYADITWMEINTVEGKFYVASKENDLFVRLFDFYGLSGARPHPSLPVGNISFLDGIPPIGTKLALNINYNTTSLGPNSEPNHIHGDKKRTLYFYFGLPKPDDSKKQQFTMPAVNDLL
ncbi:MAG TPA: glycoside hydrolase family 2 TIM barrel-domain containing protein [Phnomibacter sp.]|nr:glycoside hydrolase family 2 TIM barrel-domain containing protein [Phnomibacter sp.]